jgi:tRNA(Ile)-lysidine synthase
VQLAEPPLSSFPLSQIFSPLNGLSRVALAVSGGSDSAAMMRLIHEWTQPSVDVFVLTVDHGLRREAAAEAELVAQWSEELGFKHVTLRWPGEKPATGIQAKARAARYDLMSAWCLAHEVSVLLTAHTADDQAETVLMRSARTQTAKSLAGIWPERNWNGVRVLRPLLGMRRAALRDYLAQHQRQWVEDPSNHDSQFERVRVRQALAGETRGYDSLAQLAQDTMQQVARAADGWCAENLEHHETGFVNFPRSKFKSLAPELCDEILLRVISLCGTGVPPEKKGRENLLAWLLLEGGSRRALGGVIFAKRQGSILVGREEGRISSVPQMIPETGEFVWDNRFLVNGPAGAKITAASQVKGLSRRKDIPAFVQAGLPAILLENNHVCVPLLKIGAGATCRFVRY